MLIHVCIALSWDVGKQHKQKRAKEKNINKVMMEVHALLRRSSKRKTRTCNKDVYAAAHVTWSKLKLNCTNPSYRLTIPFLCASLSMTGQTDYYSVLFPFFFGWILHLSFKMFLFSFFHFIIILLFYFPSVVVSLLCVFSFQVIQTETVSSARSRLIPSRHWCVLSFTPFEWVFYLETCWAPWRRSSGEVERKKTIF